MEYGTALAVELIRACAEGDPAAWREFMRRYNRTIAIAVYRVARQRGEESPTLVDDLTQDTYLKLWSCCRPDFRKFKSSDRGFLAYLHVVATHVGNDHFKKLRAIKRNPGTRLESLDDINFTDRAVSPADLAGTERKLLFEEIDTCLSALAPAENRERDRMIFWLYYRQGLTSKEIAPLPGVRLSQKGVESILKRMTQLVRDHLGKR